MQINKGNINLKEQLACVATSTLVEGDIVLSDSCPDVAEILLQSKGAEKASNIDIKMGGEWPTR